MAKFAINHLVREWVNPAPQIGMWRGEFGADYGDAINLLSPINRKPKKGILIDVVPFTYEELYQCSLPITEMIWEACLYLHPCPACVGAEKEPLIIPLYNGIVEVNLYYEVKNIIQRDEKGKLLEWAGKYYQTEKDYRIQSKKLWILYSILERIEYEYRKFISEVKKNFKYKRSFWNGWHLFVPKKHKCTINWMGYLWLEDRAGILQTIPFDEKIHNLWMTHERKIEKLLKVLKKIKCFYEREEGIRWI